MKSAFAILLFLPLSFYSQSKQDNFNYIDRKVQDIPFSGAQLLAERLASLGHSPKEKVRAIFMWIATHIDYDVRRYYPGKKYTGDVYDEPYDSLAPLLSLNERVAAKVLARKTAFCDGYARLFKTLCDYSGIRCEIIYGYARTNLNRSGKFAVNHTWNSVLIDNSWHLLDVTWASGFISYGYQYYRQPNETYFLTRPEDFIMDHYPEDLNWTLLKEPPPYREFNRNPFRYSGYIKAGITSYFPEKGIIEVSTGDTVNIEINTNRELRTFFVSESVISDTAQLYNPPGFNIEKEKISFRHPVSPEAGEWLYVYCNDELALRYKLNLKKDLVKDK